MITRPAVFSDLDRPDVRELISRGICSGTLAEIDWPKVWGMCRQLVSSPFHHVSLAFNDGKAVAYLGAMRTQTWEAKDKFLVVGWFSEHRGAGMKLLNELLARAKADDEIGAVMVVVNSDHDEKLARVLSRRGATTVPTFNIYT
ncbi:hypothetical protein UFOVP891_53 [uncultured Caudovirales phage]|uniref:N-acetyltransferase domain-containing protein n=1 Tax=uncultured Caudovirales phage TaxID=2100421 RepID=A0A6J5QMF4_9CAUD|nr:hypothetical protein UFOVP472_14 [uncultured Caudovirales phage]CAB4169214.1 hypothetical protein UFOVP891_53 [uncultured Caudovirales phage]CAB4180754.1 hypothetical protein UFOVP1053_14 [uncultured Caudovirales phage]CAB4196139.1 hypothetical protein UFOVP1297_59 [uncultured Caudovirales phage]CAB4221901.1 hypothetical protein UFOVP1647_37 [uncultured Caudovirales phage]